MKLQILLLSLLCSLPILANEFPLQLIVWAKDGTQVAYSLKEKPKISFRETDLVITTKGIEFFYPLDKIQRVTYQHQTTAVKNQETENNIPFTFNGESLIFPTHEANSVVSVYTNQGTPILRRTVSHNGEYAFSLSNLKSGIYIIQVNSRTYKIVKK